MQQFSGVNALDLTFSFFFSRSPYLEMKSNTDKFQRLLSADFTAAECGLLPTDEPTIDSLQRHILLGRCILLPSPH
jgi:hypothetical protein